MPEIFQGFVRELTAEELGIDLPASALNTTTPDAALPDLPDNDPFVLKVLRLLNKFGGVILTGPPGTSKSMRANEVARKLTDGPENRGFVQFHASYQYEDFITGYVPDEEGSGFKSRPAIFLQACKRAEAIAPKRFVLVIDEFSRADVGRVFGEALTYVERSKRGEAFTVASGKQYSVPDNLLIIATMNPYDRGVDEVDAAFERRFAKISMEPDRDILIEMLAAKGLIEPVRTRVVAWFDFMGTLRRDTPMAAVGHAYFADVPDVESLREVWEHQLQFHVDRAFRNNSELREQVVTQWRKIFNDVPGNWDGNTFQATDINPPEGEEA